MVSAQKKKSIGTFPEEAQTLELLLKNFKSAILNMVKKKLKETMLMN